jgi:hypothetical protein
LGRGAGEVLPIRGGKRIDEARKPKSENRHEVKLCAKQIRSPNFQMIEARNAWQQRMAINKRMPTVQRFFLSFSILTI